MPNSFVTWLQDKIEERHWKLAEFARQAEIDPSTVTLVLKGQRKPGRRFCKGVARAFGDVTEEEVLRLAGLLPVLPRGSESTLRDLVDLAKNMPREDQLELVEYARWRFENRHKKSLE